MALLQQPRPDRQSKKSVVFVTFESEFAPVGGLAAVMRILPRHMARLSDHECLTIAPLFRNITRCKELRWKTLEKLERTCRVRFDGDYHTVTLFRHVDDVGFSTYLLDAEAFFNAPCDCGNPPAPETPCNPYLNPGDPDQLLTDALFFSAAVPKALVALGYTKNLILSLQDWQTAPTAITAKSEPSIASAACVLTIHNPYDHPLSDESLAKIFWRQIPGPTVLTKMLPFVDGPICTVSENFAHELTNDPLHTAVYAPHLQNFFRAKGVRGIDNGLFAELDFPQEAREAARQGAFAPLLAEKAHRRAALVRVLKEYQPEEAWGTLSDLEQFEGPILLLFGRDDPRQKGYDVAAAAIRRLEPGQAKFVFTPIPGEEGAEGLSFLRTLAEERAGEVKVFPFRMEQGYMELQRGSSYLVMSSLYEPFGGATEGYAVGTPIVARATGGLVQQIAPYPGGSLSRAVWERTAHFHARHAPPTGFLFREPDLSWEAVVHGWRTMIDLDYKSEDRITGRSGTRLYDAMVREAAWALQDAIRLYRESPTAYAELIANGFEMLQAFSWDRAVREYQRVYALVCE
ncbi:MAG: glycogen/starch synthase [Anaerolineales bacterium]